MGRIKSRFCLSEARCGQWAKHRRPRPPHATRRYAMKYTKPELKKHATLKQVTFSSH